MYVSANQSNKPTTIKTSTIVISDISASLGFPESFDFYETRFQVGLKVVQRRDRVCALLRFPECAPHHFVHVDLAGTRFVGPDLFVPDDVATGERDFVG